MYKHGILCFLFVALSACGGGGGGGTQSSGDTTSASPTGATLTLNNATRFAQYVKLTRSLGSTVAFYPNVSLTGTDPSISFSVTSPCTAPGIPGAQGGGTLFTLTRDNASKVSGTVSFGAFNACQDAGLYGSGTVTGTLPGSTLSDLTLTLSKFRIVDGSSTYYNFTGTINVVWTGAGNRKVTINGTISDDGGTPKPVFVLTNFLVDNLQSKTIAYAFDVQLNGRILDSASNQFADVLSSSILVGCGGLMGNGSYKLTGAPSSNMTVSISSGITSIY